MELLMGPVGPANPVGPLGRWTQAVGPLGPAWVHVIVIVARTLAHIVSLVTQGPPGGFPLLAPGSGAIRG